MMSRQAYCESCNGIHEFDTKYLHMEYNVKGETIHIFGEQGICNNCKNDVSDMQMIRRNQNLAFNLYRQKFNLISVEDIIHIRKKYNLSQKEFSLLLGFGEIQITRYEKGTLPNPAHSMLISQAKEPMFMLDLINTNGYKLDPSVINELRGNLERIKEGEMEIIQPLREMLEQPSSPQSGFNPYNWNKMKSLIAFFAKEQNPYFTKMCKLLFFTDFYHFKEFGRSITGSRYVRMPYGPCPENHEVIFESSPDTTIEPGREVGKCIKLSNRNVNFDFSQQEWQIIKLVNDKFKSMTSKEISDFSHEEDAWLKVRDFHYISYDEHAEKLDLQREFQR